MLPFWFVIAIMTLLALGFILMPLIRIKPITPINSQQLQISIYKEKLLMLDTQLKNSEITQEDYQIAREEFDAALLQDVSEKMMVFKTNPSYRTAIIAVILFPLISIFLYFHWGYSASLSQWLVAKKQAALVKSEVARFGSTKKIIAAMQQKLQQNPNSAKGWYLLGKLYLSQQQFSNAAQAFAKANQLQNNDPDIMLAFAESLFLAGKGELNAQGKMLVNTVLKLSPQNVNALNLLAMSEYHHGNYQSAINNWEKMLPQFPADSSDAKTLSNMIDDAEKRLGITQAPIKLSVQITLADNLKNQIKPGDTLFIYAQAVNGPPMPLAVVKKHATDLPLTTTLDQKDFMLPNMTLANFNQVKIFARISKSGQAIPQVGDYVGSSDVIDPKHNNKMIAIVIDHAFNG